MYQGLFKLGNLSNVFFYCQPPTTYGRGTDGAMEEGVTGFEEVLRFV